jgi:uncharacterized protein
MNTNTNVPVKTGFEEPRRPSHPAKIVYDAYRDIDGQWRWRAWARNGKIVANCGEGYKRKIDCVKMVNLLRFTQDLRRYAIFPLFVEGVLQ